MQYRRPHPYNPHYALPDHVMAEPPGTGTFTTAYSPRGTYTERPRGWTGGYAQPAYIEAEPSARGAMMTHWLPRRWLPMPIPEALGADDDVRPGFVGDPIASYGQRVSQYLMRSLQVLPVEVRRRALQALLNNIDPTLDATITERATHYRDRGMDPKHALRSAIASSMSEGLAKEIIAYGRGKKPLPVQSQLGLGYYGSIAGLGAWWNPVDAVKAVGGAIKDAAAATGSGIARGAQATGRGVSTAASWSWGKTKGAAGQVYDWGKSAAVFLGKASCTVLTSDLAPVAGAAAAGALGVPPQAGAAGVQIAGGLCPKDEKAPSAEPLPVPATPSFPSWLLPAGIVGGGLVLLLALK
jgi:hypothetical protein